ncbi:MAG: hypothetical protein AAFX08_04090 [Pseudomonadota bacterium]
MEVTPIGVLCLLAVAIVVARPFSFGMLIVAGFIPLQAAAAANLWAVGGMSLICAHVLVGALVAGVALRPRLAQGALQSGVSKSAVLILALFVLYGAFSAFMFPRLFEGEVAVYSLERAAEGGISLSPLHPTTGNITQPFYMAINLFLFGVAAFILSSAGGLVRATHVVNTVTLVHLAFAIVSVAPYLPPNAILLDFIRTANYAINDHHSLAGVPRLIGSYPEPAVFGSLSVGLFAWNFVRFMQTRGLWHFVAALMLLGCIALSLSTTAYATLIVMIGLWALHSAYRAVRNGLEPGHVSALLFGAAFAGIGASLILIEPMQAFSAEVFERLFGSKLQSSSGRERGAWAMQSFQNFVDTYGLGVGLGSARASGLAAVLVGNVGVVGAILYLAFLNRSFLRPWPRAVANSAARDQAYARRIFVAARAGAASLLASQLISGGSVDAGLLFILFAAVATSAFPASQRSGRAFDFGPGVGAALAPPRKSPFFTPPPRPSAGGA